MSLNRPEYLLEFRNVSKSFGPVKANDQVNFSVQPGSIHALVGENGAGKSTIMKILFGLYHPDSGDILYKSQPVRISSPTEAKNLGIGMIHQHFMLAGALSALDHLIIDENAKPSLFSRINRREKLKAYSDLSEKFHMPVPWDKNIEDLSVGIQQRIEILKLLNNHAEVLILDEPTAVLAPQEIEKLFIQLRALKAMGKTILIVTHKLKEVFAIADKVTVFRQGKSIATKALNETSIPELSELILGRKITEDKVTPPKRKDLLLELKSLNLQGDKHHQLKDINLKIFNGEILGIAGVEGNGQSELIKLLISPDDHKKEISGELIWKSQSVKDYDAQNMRDLGLRFLPEDRLSQGCLKEADLKDNFIFGQQNSANFQNAGFFKANSIRNACVEAIRDFDVRPQLPEASFSKLSGGNQQKLVVARELSQKPALLIAAQPTRGVDIGASQKIHKEILNERDRGASVLLISSELDEVLKLSDRVIVMFHGRLVGEISNWSSLTDSEQQSKIQQIGCWMLGEKTDEKANEAHA